MYSISRTTRGLRVARRLLHQTASAAQQGASSQRSPLPLASGAGDADAPARPWYLDDDIPASRAEKPKGPVFTRYDPSATQPVPAEERPIRPIPPDYPSHAILLHEFLTTNPLIVPSSVAAFSSSQSRAATSQHNADELRSFLGGKKIRARRSGQDKGQSIVVDGAEVGANWEWVIVLETQARGKGAVGRVERDIRKWVGRGGCRNASPG